MTYNIHPIFVHFPIALLFIYSIIKILPLKKWFKNVSWKHIEISLLTIGVLGAFVASITGGIAEELLQKNRQLIETHSTFAEISTIIYSLLLLGEILFFITPRIFSKYNLPKTSKFILFIQKILVNKNFSIILALVGLISITITGLLGGIIVYGLTVDPIAPLLLKLLGLSL